MEDDIEGRIPGTPGGRQKYCRKCGQWKPLTEYFKRGSKSKYYAGYCKSCHSEPFRYERIVCPHCKNKIGFFGIDLHGKVVKQKSTIISKLKKELRHELKNKKKRKPKAEEIEQNLKDILK